MAKYITKAQREELEDASAFGVEEVHDLLKSMQGSRHGLIPHICILMRTGISWPAATRRTLTSCWKRHMWRCGTMGQHKHNPVAIAAAKGELLPKKREPRLTNRQAERLLKLEILSRIPILEALPPEMKDRIVKECMGNA